MADIVETTSTLSNSIMARYTEKYLEAAEDERVYDQITAPIEGKPMEELKAASSVKVPFLSDMVPGTAAIPEDTDITPQTLKDALATVTPTSRGEALQCSEKLLVQAYTDYGEKQYQRVGKNAEESIELLARDAALQGSLVDRYVARASLDAGTAAHRCTDSVFAEMQTALLDVGAPGFKFDGGEEYIAIMQPRVFHDIRNGGNVVSVGQYQDKGIHFNWELGKIGNFRLVVTSKAKAFHGAGLDNASAVATTLAAAVAALATSITVAAGTNIAVGQWLNIGTEETANTHYATNEHVKVISVSGTTIGVTGSAPNGGLRFAHASGEAVNNNDSVYPVVFSGKSGLAKVFAPEVGEYGTVLAPRRKGMLDQFVYVGWKFYGGVGRIAENRILRGEYAVSQEA
jgi:N4-gp56 family major capsid protein